MSCTSCSICFLIVSSALVLIWDYHITALWIGLEQRGRAQSASCGAADANVETALRKKVAARPYGRRRERSAVHRPQCTGSMTSEVKLKMPRMRRFHDHWRTLELQCCLPKPASSPAGFVGNFLPLAAFGIERSNGFASYKRNHRAHGTRTGRSNDCSRQSILRAC